MAEFINVYAKDTGLKHRVPAHWMEHPTLSKPFRKTPKQNAADTRALGSATPATDVVTSDASATTESAAAAGQE